MKEYYIDVRSISCCCELSAHAIRYEARGRIKVDIEVIKKKVQQGSFETSEHAEEERAKDVIAIFDIKEAIYGGKILEDYPDHPRGACCLILGYTEGGQPLRIVCGALASRRVRIITVYIPSLPKWLDPETRARKGD